MGVHLNNILSMILEPIASEAADSEEVISSEEALARLDRANKELALEGTKWQRGPVPGGKGCSQVRVGRYACTWHTCTRAPYHHPRATQCGTQPNTS